MRSIAIVLVLFGTAFATPTKGRVLHPSRALEKAPPPKHKTTWPAVELFAVNLGETLRYRPYDDHGRLRSDGDRQLMHFLRCWHDGRAHKVDPRLGRVLYQVARHFPGRRIEIFSGYRPKKYCTRAHSRHLTASAIDFRVPGVKNEALIAWLRETFHPAGVGYYPNGVHVHLDVDRARDTYWIDAGDDVHEPSLPAPPLAAVGDTAPESIDATSDEAVEVPRTGAEPSEPPSADPALPDLD